VGFGAHLIEDALEIQEDMALAALADERKKSLKKSELISHKKAWRWSAVYYQLSQGSSERWYPSVAGCYKSAGKECDRNKAHYVSWTVCLAFEKDSEGILEAQEIIENTTEEKVISSVEIKSKILNLIEKLDKGEGADYQEILTKSGLPENDVDFSIQDLLESGVCFEPIAGKIKKIG
jgi:hypothetical protein